MRTDTDIEETMEQYADMVKRICLVYMKNEEDTEDIFQDVFLKYALFSGTFHSEEHKKSWLIRVTINRCKDVLKSFFRTKHCSLEEAQNLASPETGALSDVLNAVLSLPQRYRTVIYLHYYEGYSAMEIARMTGKNENTVYTNLSRARHALKTILGGDTIG